ncbi:hypothetical protein BT93_G1903 [Corymbia citriodora subsp. variegata]|nr:hypothetical protein BT93_G1903 [Corymbia citriodora subsp. variegata]KAF8021595.1 hypothetical protein BT93_G1903 [Corymbia citriodora subsp. variegata]
MGKPKNKRRHNESDSDEDDTFYYRYASAPPPPPPQPSTSNLTAAHGGRRNSSSAGGGGGSSGGLVPSKSTLYVSNLDFSLTNSDLHTLFSTFGKVARVTVLKDRATRRSRGVAFVQFVAQPDAQRAAAEMHGKILNGRKVAASIAIDNGRAPEFIRKRVYKDKSRCYECGEDGHLSYECPKNVLGPRERPAPKKGRRGGGGREEWGGGGGAGAGAGGGGGGGDDEGEVFEEENWASVVDDGADERLLRREREEREERERVKERREKKVSYFSDESGEEDE